MSLRSRATAITVGEQQLWVVDLRGRLDLQRATVQVEGVVLDLVDDDEDGRIAAEALDELERALHVGVLLALARVQHRR